MTSSRGRGKCVNPPKNPKKGPKRGQGLKISNSKYHFRNKSWVSHTHFKYPYPLKNVKNVKNFTKNDP